MGNCALQNSVYTSKTFSQALIFNLDSTFSKCLLSDFRSKFYSVLHLIKQRHALSSFDLYIFLYRDYLVHYVVVATHSLYLDTNLWVFVFSIFNESIIYPVTRKVNK